MAKPEWGAKRHCAACGARFYDLNSDPIACPECGAIFEAEVIVRGRRVRPTGRAETAAKVVAVDIEDDVEDVVDDEDDDTVVLDDDDEDDAVVVAPAADDADDEVIEADEDVLLEEDEEDDVDVEIDEIVEEDDDPLNR